MSKLEIVEEKRTHWTAWKVVEDGKTIARFDTRGGYTRADAEAVVNSDEEDDEPTHIPCSRCGKLTNWDPTYQDLCYRCIRADNE